MRTPACWVATNVAGEQTRDRRQSGQGNIEYVGMVVGVAALIIALIAVFPSVGDNLTCKLSQAVTSVSGGSAECSGGRSEATETEHGGDDSRGDPAVAAGPRPSPSPQASPPPAPTPPPGIPYGLDPNSDLVKTMQSTARGKDALQWLRDNNVPVVLDSSKQGAWYEHGNFFSSPHIVLGGGYDTPNVLIHETNHARTDKDGRSSPGLTGRSSIPLAGNCSPC